MQHACLTHSMVSHAARYHIPHDTTRYECACALQPQLLVELTKVFEALLYPSHLRTRVYTAGCVRGAEPSVNRDFRGAAAVTARCAESTLNAVLTCMLYTVYLQDKLAMHADGFVTTI